MKPFWITFYSYKGGVGRSLALANIAALLVKKGRKVVLIDFDLEAPGLDSFDEFSSIVGKPGVVEYVTEFRRTNKAPGISEFIHECELPGPLPGRLWIMPAGTKNASYNRERVAIDWADLYESRMGVAFVENWKAAIAHQFQPDYVLVDSRTGLTDVGGICTLHLPDLVVMVFGLNEQNVKGIAAVAKTVRESDSGRVPQIHFVASPVPNLPSDKSNQLTERLESAANTIGVPIDSVIRYTASAALQEKLFVLQDGVLESPIVQNYQHILERLIEYNRNGIDLIARQVQAAISTTDISKMQKLHSVLSVEYGDAADGCFLMSRLQLALGVRLTAVLLAKKALEIDPIHKGSCEWLLDHYESECAFDEALGVCDMALNGAYRLPANEVQNLHYRKGQLAIAASKPTIAADSFAICLEASKSRNDPARIQLAYTFNLAESRRRAGIIPDMTLWRRVIKLFEESGRIADMPPTIQANQLQAIHVAFALIGDLDHAKECLMKARDAARRLGDADDVFSVVTYSELPVSQFMAYNDDMLAALERGELWDGTKLHFGDAR